MSVVYMGYNMKGFRICTVMSGCSRVYLIVRYARARCYEIV